MQPNYDLTHQTLQMAQSQPPAEAIYQVIDILGITHEQATILLRNQNNNVERSVNAYFNDPYTSLLPNPIANQQNDRTWDPSQDNIPFQTGGADPGDALSSSTGALPALSRPNSPATAAPPQPPRRNPNQQEMVDLTSTYAEAESQANRALAAQQAHQPGQDEDEDFQRAIAMSLGKPVADQPGGGGGQESGVVASAGGATMAAGQQFGPANRPQYEPAQWSMVPYASHRELIEHPMAAERKRKDGQPAFLRPSPSSGYLAALLTIYHSIPLAREALLLPPMNVLSYGYDPQWWSGSTDENRKSISMETDEENYDKDKTTLLAEVQCLMAFLSNTNRSYGSVDALNDLQALHAFRNLANTGFSTFLEAWMNSALSQYPNEQLTQIFSSTANKRMDDAPDIVKDLVCVEAAVPRIPGQTLVNLLDDTVWSDGHSEELDDTWISSAGEVFTIRLHTGDQHPDGLQVTVPHVWYPDRYMESLRDETRQMRLDIQEIKRLVNSLDQQQHRLRSFMSNNNVPIRTREILENASKLCRATLEDRYSEYEPGEDVAQLDVGEIEGHIKKVLSRIDRKLQRLESRKTGLHAKIQKMDMQYTQPGDDPTHPPYMKYVLQGVSTKPEITYTRVRNPDLLGLDDENSERQEWQWWRTEWKTPQSQASFAGPVSLHHPQQQGQEASMTDELANLPYSIQAVTEEAVAKAARSENNSVVLVYANEKAINFENSSLPVALRKFVEQDNIMFGRELRNDTNVESGAASDEEGTWMNLPADTGDAGETVDQQMTPVSSIISSPRDEDGQPSLKRPKSLSGGHARGLEADGLPSYDEAIGEPVPEMQEKSGNRIGMYAEAMLEKYGNGSESRAAHEGEGQDQQGQAVHIERAPDLPR
jgi:hypothetical protein